MTDTEKIQTIKQIMDRYNREAKQGSHLPYSALIEIEKILNS